MYHSASRLNIPAASITQNVIGIASASAENQDDPMARRGDACIHFSLWVIRFFLIFCAG